MKQNRRNSASLLKASGEAPSKISFLLCLSKVWTIPLFMHCLLLRGPLDEVSLEFSRNSRSFLEMQLSLHRMRALAT